MGPAILNGGITTFLALFFLAFSQSYAFIVFFKVSSSFFVWYEHGTRALTDGLSFFWHAC